MIISAKLEEFLSGIKVLRESTDEEYAQSVFNTLVVLYNNDPLYYKNEIYWDINETNYRKQFSSPLVLSRRKEEGKEVPYNSKGLYLIGTTTFNPYTEEKFYWIKIGSTSSTFNKRLKQYSTHNPAYYKIDFLVDAEYQESIYHLYLAKIAIEKTHKGDEWFRVSKEDYLNISKLGFKFFNIDN